ncbi:MAG: hypothetical protein AAB833_01745 [Patescibacteria group bacterium]
MTRPIQMMIERVQRFAPPTEAQEELKETLLLLLADLLTRNKPVQYWLNWVEAILEAMNLSSDFNHGTLRFNGQRVGLRGDYIDEYLRQLTDRPEAEVVYDRLIRLGQIRSKEDDRLAQMAHAQAMAAQSLARRLAARSRETQKANSDARWNQALVNQRLRKEALDKEESLKGGTGTAAKPSHRKVAKPGRENRGSVDARSLVISPLDRSN